MGIFNGDNENPNPLKIMKKVGKKAISFLIGISALLSHFPAIMIGILLATIIGTAFSFVVDVNASEKTAESIYEKLEIEDMSDLVEIKKNGDGYYIDFKEDADEKLEDVIKYLNDNIGTHNVPGDKEFLKELIKAELVTKFPDLGGNVPEDSSGFQGAVNLRRISPNKEMGELTSKGKGETSNIEQDEADTPNEDGGEYEKIVKSWEKEKELYVNVNATVYKQTESEINPGSDTGNWEYAYDESNRKIEIKKGTKVTYTGIYKTATNALTGVATTYVEVKNDKVTGFVKAQYLSVKKNETSNIDSNTSSKNQYAKVTNRAKGNKTMGDENQNYTIAIQAAYNGENGLESGDLKEKELTKKVANKVESLCEEYSNVKIVKVDGISEMKKANPDMAIVIYFNYSQNGQETGIDTIYKEGDEISHQFADILSKNISSSMGLENLYAGEDTEKIGKSLTSMESYRATGFPSVITRGGYLNGEKEAELLKSDGTDKYAKGIVKSIEEYINANKEGYTATELQKQTVQQSIESKVIKMKYVPEETFKKYVEENNKEALKCFSLDKDFKLLTATWKYEKEDEKEKVEISENTAMDFRSTLQQYVMPYEYLLFFYTDADYEEFSLDLAKKVQETEIVVAVQDNVTTTQTVEVTKQQKIVTPSKYQQGYGSSWHETNTKKTKTETVSTSIDVTYVNTWFVKAYKESSYSEKILKMGDKDEVILDLKGTATDTESNDKTSPKQVESGTILIPVVDENYVQTYEKATYKIEETTETSINTYSDQYNTGESKTEGKENVFVNLYQKHNMIEKVRERWLLQIIENNEHTANLLELTEYLMYKSTSENYGKVEYDFSIYDLSSFSDIYSSSSGLETFKEYLHAWEGHTGISEDGTKYRVGDDGYGHPTVGYGVDIYNSGYKDRFIAAGYDISIGSYIDVDFVDAIEEEEIQSKIKIVEEKTAGLNLTIYQKYALVSRSYNCGSTGAFTTRNGKTFVEAYKAYWNQDTDDEYKVTANNNMYNHKLYTEYMSKPNTSNGEYSKGLENRRKSEWILFKTGYYDRINKWCSNTEGGTIVESAVEVHKYVRTNGYYYQQAGVTLPNTKTKTIDCSSYVTWVLVNSHITGFKEGMSQWNSSTFIANPLGWQVVSVKEAQPGDIVAYSGHVEIIAENDINSSKFRVYNCGGNSSIKADGGNSGLPESSMSGRTKTSSRIILRPPQ